MTNPRKPAERLDWDEHTGAAANDTKKYRRAASDDPADKLTPKQRTFCREYIKDMNVRAAHIRAGYAPKSLHNSYNLLKRSEVKAYIHFLVSEEKAKFEVTEISVKNAFLRIALACEADGNYSNALRAYENLAKWLGMFVERHETSLSVDDKTANLDEQTTKQELDRVLSNIRARPAKGA